MAPLRRDRPGPLIGRARHPLRTRRRMQASNKPKSMGAHTVAYHAHIFVGGPLRIHGYLGVPGSRMPVQPPDTRTSGSLPRARPRFDKSASRTACKTTCEGYITLNPKVNMRSAHSLTCSMAASKRPLRRALPRGSRACARAAAGHARHSRHDRSMSHVAARRPEPGSALVNKLQGHCQAP